MFLKKWNQPRSPSKVDKENVAHIYAQKFYLAIKKETTPERKQWNWTKIIILQEIWQTQINTAFFS